MPISQHRVIALINAALDYKQALDKINLSIAVAADQGRDPQAALEQLALLANPATQLRDIGTSLATLTIEYHHFRRFARRNERVAKRSAARRAAEGAITRATTPRDATLSNAAALPSSLQYNLKPSQLSQSQKDDIDLMTELPNGPATCPFCGATDFDDCKQKVNCQWAAQFEKDQEEWHKSQE